MTTVIGYRGSVDFKKQFTLFANTDNGLEKLYLDTSATRLIAGMLTEVKLTDITEMVAHTILSHYYNGSMAGDVYYDDLSDFIRTYMSDDKPGGGWNMTSEVLEDYIQKVTDKSNEEMVNANSN